MLLLNLNWLLVLLVFHLLFKFLSLHILKVLKIRIENHPLGGLQREGHADWWVSLDTSMLEWHVECLGRSFLEVELISKRLLLGEIICGFRYSLIRR